MWVALAVLSGQLSIGWTNDYLDRHRDRRAARADKPLATGHLSPTIVARSAVLAMAACIPLSMASGWKAGSVHLAAVACGLGYDAGLKSTRLSFLPYAVAFGALPGFVTLGLPDSSAPPLWSVAAGALLGVGAHFVNTLADRDQDEQTGVRGLPQRLAPGLSLAIGVSALIAATLLIALSPPGPPEARALAFLLAALGAGGGVVAAAILGRPRLAWWLTIGVAVLAVGGLIINGEALAS